MAAFSRGPDDITARLSEVIELLQGDGLQAQADVQTTLFLKELNRLLNLIPNPVEGEGSHFIDQAAQTGMDRGKLAHLREIVREARIDILSGDLELALKRFKQARDSWKGA
jgi:ethanolamine utilization cobalamin adenosyltransferase